MNAVCLVIDRLHAGHIGAYGNSWIETPQLDRLAGQSFVFDQVLIDSPRLTTLYRSYWSGWHAMCPGEPAEERPALCELLRASGVNSALLTDEPLVAKHPLAVHFDELIEIDPPWEPQVADAVEHTHLAKCFAQAIDWMESAEQPFLLWCHLAGLGATWDAPLEFRRSYWEQGDPRPPNSAVVPNLLLPEDHDPDLLLGIVQSYAGQVSLFDTCLGAMLELLDDSPLGRETLLTVTSSRGFPLGEHRRVGPCDEALYGELVHVPWMTKFPDGRGAAARSQNLLEPADLWATLLDYWAVAEVPPSATAASVMPIAGGRSAAVRDRLCLPGEGAARAIRTPAWYLYNTAEPQLFAKPGDRWEVNDVANRCHEVVECLQDAITQYEQTLHAGRIADLPPLGEVLLTGLE